MPKDHEEIYVDRLYKKLKPIVDTKIENYVKTLPREELCKLLDFEVIGVALKEEVLEDIKNLQRSQILTNGIRYEIRRIMKAELKQEFKAIMDLHRMEFERIKTRLYGMK